MRQPEVLTLELPHLRMGALAWGQVNRPLALLIHGFPDSAWSWREVGPLLAERGYRVVAPFTRGYAPTDLPADGIYTLGALMHDVLAIHRYLDGDDKSILIGHDWGSLTVGAVAGNPDSPFRSVVMMAMPSISSIMHYRGNVRRHLSLIHRQVRNSWYIIFFQTPLLPERILDRLIPKFWKDWTPPIRDLRDDIAHAQAALCSRERRAAAVNYYRSLVQARRPTPRYAALHKHRFDPPRVPLLYLHGVDDGALQPGYAAIARDWFPAGSKTVMVPDAGHFLQMDNPARVADEIAAFLSDRKADGQISGDWNSGAAHAT